MAVGVVPLDSVPVYFIQAANGPIKIGVARDPKNRLRDLQVGNAYPLELLGVLPGAFREEYKLHTLFSADRMSGEWFEPSDDLMRFIRSGGEVWDVTLQDRWDRALRFWVGDDEYERPGEYTGHPDQPVCRQCGVNLRATEPGVDEVGFILAHLSFPEMCGACREFKGLREADADPFTDLEEAA